jgi:hypothetical protein
MTAKSMDSIAPSQDGTLNTLTMMATLDATARFFALPAGFQGNYLRVRPVGAAVRWVVRGVPQGGTPPANALAMIDATVAVAADPPAQSPKLGSYVPDGTEVERELPYCNGTLYIAWQGTGAGTFVQFEKGSGKPATVLEP